MRAWPTRAGICIGLRFQSSKELTKTVLWDQTGRSWWHVAMEQPIIAVGEVRRNIQLRPTRLLYFIESLLVALRGAPRQGWWVVMGGFVWAVCLWFVSSRDRQSSLLFCLQKPNHYFLSLHVLRCTVYALLCLKYPRQMPVCFNSTIQS